MVYFTITAVTPSRKEIIVQKQRGGNIRIKGLEQLRKEDTESVAALIQACGKLAAVEVTTA